MLMKKHWLGLIFFSLALGVPMGEPANARPPVNAKASAPAHGLSADQLKQLKALGIKIMVPGYLPKDYRVYSVYATVEKGHGPGSGPKYTIAYTGAGAEMFAIEAVSGGIGGPPADKTQKVKHAQLGIIPFYTQLHKDNPPFYLTEWIGNGPFYHMVSPAMVNRKLQPQPMPVVELIKIVQSLTFL